MESNEVIAICAGSEFCKIIVVAVAALGNGNVVDLVVAGNRPVCSDQNVPGNLQHADFIVDKIQLHIHDHVGVAVVGFTVVGGAGGHVAALSASVNAQHQNVQLLAVQAFGRIDELVDGNGAALGTDGIHDDADGTGKDQGNHQHGTQQNLPPGDFLLAFAVLAFSAAVIVAALPAAAAGSLGRSAARSTGSSRRFCCGSTCTARGMSCTGAGGLSGSSCCTGSRCSAGSLYLRLNRSLSGPGSRLPRCCTVNGPARGLRTGGRPGAVSLTLRPGGRCGLGGALGDLILGYTFYAPFTLVIKALEGLIAGLLFKAFKSAFIKEGGTVKKVVFSAVSNVVGGLIMAAGYFLAEGLLLAEGKWQGGLVNLPWNILQGALSAVVAAVVLFVCRLDVLFDKVFYRSGNRSEKDEKEENKQEDSDVGK